MENKIECNLCNCVGSDLINELSKKPLHEIDYKITPSLYFRQIRKCRTCGVYFNHYNSSLLSDNFYNGFYNESIENGNLQKRFDRIIRLPIEKSDNKNRVLRILDFLKSKFQNNYMYKNVLDVGSGTGVFLYELRKHIKNIYSIDPDKKAINFIKKNIDVNGAWVGTLSNVSKDLKFDLITFNKVLEHIENPIKTLTDSSSLLSEKGLVYIELPFADYIIESNNQVDRAEFFIEHLTIFNEKSIKYLVENSNLTLLYFDVIIEPSGKNTIFAFAEKNIK